MLLLNLQRTNPTIVSKMAAALYHPDGWSVDSFVGASPSERVKSAARALFKSFCWAELIEVKLCVVV